MTYFVATLAENLTCELKKIAKAAVEVSPITWMLHVIGVPSALDSP